MAILTLNDQDLLPEIMMECKDFYYDNRGIIWKNKDTMIENCEFQHLDKSIILKFDRNAIETDKEEIYMFINI